MKTILRSFTRISKVTASILLLQLMTGCQDESAGGSGGPQGSGDPQPGERGEAPAISFEAVPAPEGAKTYKGYGITFNYPEAYDKIEVQDHGAVILIQN